MFLLLLFLLVCLCFNFNFLFFNLIMLRGILIKCLLLTKLNCINVLILHVLNKTLSAIVYKTKHKCLYRDDNDRYISIFKLFAYPINLLETKLFHCIRFHFNLAHCFTLYLYALQHITYGISLKKIFLTLKSSISPILLKHFFRNKKTLC